MPICCLLSPRRLLSLFHVKSKLALTRRWRPGCGHYPAEPYISKDRTPSSSHSLLFVFSVVYFLGFFTCFLLVFVFKFSFKSLRLVKFLLVKFLPRVDLFFCLLFPDKFGIP